MKSLEKTKRRIGKERDRYQERSLREKKVCGTTPQRRPPISSTGEDVLTRAP